MQYKPLTLLFIIGVKFFMIYIYILIIGVVIYYLLKRVIIPLRMIHKGKVHLNKSFFPLGEVQKKTVIRVFHKITENKYTDKQAIDYFIKEKGLQFMSVTPGAPLKIKYYLARPTLVQLTYFERVELHKAFINYQASDVLFNSKKSKKR